MVQAYPNDSLESYLRRIAHDLHVSQHKRELVQQSEIHEGDFTKLRADYVSIEKKLEDELNEATGKQRLIIERDLDRTRTRIQQIDNLAQYQQQLNNTLAQFDQARITLAEIYHKHKPATEQRESSYLVFLPYPETA